MLALVACVACVACGNPPQEQPRAATPDNEIAELWQEPTDLLQRDLLVGPIAEGIVPPATNGTFEFVARKTGGSNPGYEVRDPAGRPWSVKLGIEAQPEVTASRILWAMGYAQPPQFYVPQFTLKGGGGGVKNDARFRTDGAWKAVGEWSWYDNPFLNTPQFRGLIVAQLLLNNWDLKTVNNRVYEAVAPATRPRRQFIVRDVGASLGYSKQSRFFKFLATPGGQGSKADIDAFEKQGFIKKVDGDKVSFDYRGMNSALLGRVKVADVIWACELANRIPDGHWQSAFKAGGFGQDEAGRYIKKIKEKIAQGLALKSATP